MAIASGVHAYGLELHRLAKSALKGNREALESLVAFLMSYDNPVLRSVAYLIVYQALMNLDPDAAEECRKCGGVCCRVGPEIPLYLFDLEDLKSSGIDLVNNTIKCSNSSCSLPRPCPLQVEWMCSIHKFKPYSCLSYPFASEDVQQPVLENAVEIPPKPVVPSICSAAKLVWERVQNMIKTLEERGRKPEPLEIFDSYLERLGIESKRFR